MATEKYKFGKGKHGAKAVKTDLPGGEQQVGLSLRVYIMQDEKFWFAQGLEIDYATQGNTIEEAKQNFSDGLAGTIDLHLQMHGSIAKLLKPSDVLQILHEAARGNGTIHTYSQVSIHDIGIQSQGDLFFAGIEYFKLEKVAA
jgi:predicted RNase H-like HicB family nuclease